MAVSFVAAGAVQSVSGTSDSIPTPAGSVGDLLIFLLVHDDFSDGNLVETATTWPDELTEFIPSQSTQYAMDARCNAYWGIAGAAASEEFVFGTLATSEEIRGVCIRFSGHHATVPILAGTPTRAGGLGFVDLTATEAGQMFVEVVFSDLNTIARTPKTGWTERVDSSAAGASIYCATKPVTTQELTVRNPSATHSGTTGLGYGFGFVIDQTGETARTIAGVTKDKDGSVLVSCEVSLFKETAAGVYACIATQTSDGTTGAYSVTVYDADAAYMVYAHKAGSPNVFDATDNVLPPA